MARIRIQDENREISDAQEIRDLVSAVYGPIPLAMVVEYLRALESIKVIEAVK